MEPPVVPHLTRDKVAIGKRFLALLKPPTGDPNSTPGGTDPKAIPTACTQETGEWRAQTLNRTATLPKLATDEYCQANLRSRPLQSLSPAPALAQVAEAEMDGATGWLKNVSSPSGCHLLIQAPSDPTQITGCLGSKEMS